MKPKKLSGVDYKLGPCQKCYKAYAFGGQLGGKWLCDACAEAAGVIVYKDRDNAKLEAQLINGGVW